MPDMLVKLYDLPEKSDAERLRGEGIVVKRALIPDKARILEFVRANFGDGWTHECEYALFNNPISCYIAVKNREVIGFACYDATARDFFGPIGVKSEERHSGVGRELLIRCLLSMKEAGYAYAIIGWVGHAAPFYEKTVNAAVIPDSTPEKSVYHNMIRID